MEIGESGRNIREWDFWVTCHCVPLAVAAAAATPCSRQRLARWAHRNVCMHVGRNVAMLALVVGGNDTREMERQEYGMREQIGYYRARTVARDPLKWLPASPPSSARACRLAASRGGLHAALWRCRRLPVLCGCQVSPMAAAGGRRAAILAVRLSSARWHRPRCASRPPASRAADEGIVPSQGENQQDLGRFPAAASGGRR